MKPDGAHIQRTPLVFVRATINLILHRLGLREMRFRRAFATHAEALAAVRPGWLAGYEHEEVTDIAFEDMCQIHAWDWPVIEWLRRLAPEIRCVLDAGGHQGTKFRAFRNHLDLTHGLQWVIYDLPPMVRAGRQRAASEGLSGLSFVDSMADVPDADVLLASGLLQYLEQPFDHFLQQLPALPRHLLLNKVATREGPTVVTLEHFRCAEVPYHIRNRASFLASLTALGYDIVDQWEIPGLARQILTHPHLGVSVSYGYYAKLRT